MVVFDFIGRATSFQNLVLLLLWIHKELTGVVASEMVYFNEYSHCIKLSRGEAFKLEDDSYHALSAGGDFNHRNTDCSLSFVAASGYGVCMTFKEFDMSDDCLVSLLVYEAKNSKGDVWKTLTCNSVRPSQMCTSGRYVTLRVKRKELNEKGPFKYNFNIEIEQSSSVTDEGVVFASIGLVVGITLGVVVVVIIIIAVVVFNCCRNKGDASTNKRAMPADDPAQPTAPPLMEGEEERPETTMHLYPYLQQDAPMLGPPPPYELPPSYSAQHT